MNHYIDITLLPSDDIGIHFLWSKVMMQLHLALVEIQDENKKAPVAASFPQYREKKAEKQGFLGHQLRLFAINKADLERLNIPKWFDRLSDYVHIKTISDVPETNMYETYARYNADHSVDKLIRRRMRWKHETLEQATKYYEGYQAEPEDRSHPFIRMKSLETQHEFCLSIVRKIPESVLDTAQSFNTYGLSTHGVLPKF